MFDTKVVVLVLEDLAVWQKLNVTAFLATGIAGIAPDALGSPYEDADGRTYARMLGQPIMVLSADSVTLARARKQAADRNLGCAAYVRAMFSTGHDAANREVFRLQPVDEMDIFGLALIGPKKDVDKASKGGRLHE